MSDIKRKLFNHQIKAIEGCIAYPFRLIYRLPGTGKTVIGVELVKRQFSKNIDSLVLWLGPANLIMQYQNVFQDMNIAYNIFKSESETATESFKISSGACVIASYEMLRLHDDKFLDKHWDCVLCDEFHRAKNKSTQTNSVLKNLRKKSASFFAFTGTPFQNSPYEFFELINIVSGKNLSFACENTLQYKRPKRSILRMLLGKMGFRTKRLNQGPIVGVSAPKRLHGLISNYIDYIKPEEYMQECHLPIVSESIERVQLTEAEAASYKNELKTYKKGRDRKFLQDDLNDDKLETAFNNLVKLRQNLLSMDGKISSKILRCVSDLKTVLTDKTNRVLVFSNFVKHGLKQLAVPLAADGIKFSLYDGDTPLKERKNILQAYFSGEVPLMLLSPVGFEGLDLYGTTHIFVLDPHFNPERTRQLVSRAVRAYSGVKKIEVCHYIAIINGFKQPCIDEAILRIAERKRQLAKMIENCLLPDAYSDNFKRV